ncbi:MAG: methyltransferase domain-containing protein [Desulfovermiculus sp.]
MPDNNQEDLKFSTKQDYANWVKATDWYQTIHLSFGITTPGKVRTDKRISELEKLDFIGKSVLDVGCNSGQYSLLAKKKGALRVVGVDIDSHRIHQAKVLAANENLSVDFQLGGIEMVPSLGQFDIVICIAVLTEIENVLGGLRILRESTGGQTIIEMGLARPILYLSYNRRWFHRDEQVSRFGKVGELQRHKHAGWVLYPSIEIVQDIFGPNFRVDYKGRRLRYDLLHVQKLPSS